MIFDPTVSLGTIIQLAGIVVGALIVAQRFTRRLEHLEWRVGVLWRAFLLKHPELERVFLEGEGKT